MVSLTDKTFKFKWQNHERVIQDISKQFSVLSMWSKNNFKTIFR